MQRGTLIELFGKSSSGKGGGVLKLDKDAMRAMAQVISVAVESGKLAELSGWAGHLLDTVSAAADRGVEASVSPPPNVWAQSQTMKQATDATKGAVDSKGSMKFAEPEAGAGRNVNGLPAPKPAAGVTFPKSWTDKPAGHDPSQGKVNPDEYVSQPDLTDWFGDDDWMSTDNGGKKLNVPQPKKSETPFQNAKTKGAGPTDFNPPKDDKQYNFRTATRRKKPADDEPISSIAKMFKDRRQGKKAKGKTK